LPASRGIDERRRAALRQMLSIAPIVTVLAGTPAALFVYASIRSGSPWWAGLRSAPAIVALVIFAWIAFSMGAMVVEVVGFASVCPYFERRVGNIDTFGRGGALARRHRELDALAGRLGVAPLSHFGFADDLEGETLVWHDPTDGLATVDALLAALRADVSLRRGQPRVVADLVRVADALEKARLKGIRFCLLYRPGGGTSGQEWDVRKGTAF
jgi:hypothetical protein